MNRWSRVLASCNLILLAGLPLQALADSLSSAPQQSADSIYRLIQPQCVPDNCPTEVERGMLRLVMEEEPEQVADEQLVQADARQARQKFYRRLVLLMSIARR